jgi:rhodanese-related sulfurtransferase
MNGEQLLNIRNNNQPYTLIDIREQYEYEHINIGGVHIPMGEMLNRLDEIPKDSLVIIHCQSGVRGEKMTKVLNSLGYNNVHNLEGGIEAIENMITTQSQK